MSLHFQEQRHTAFLHISPRHQLVCYAWIVDLGNPLRWMAIPGQGEMFFLEQFPVELNKLSNIN